MWNLAKTLRNNCLRQESCWITVQTLCASGILPDHCACQEPCRDTVQTLWASEILSRHYVHQESYQIICASGILLNHCAHWESYRDIMQTLCTSGILPRHCATTMRVKNPVGSLCTSRILLEHCVNIVHIKSPAGSSCQHCAQLESCRDIVQTLYASGILPDYYVKHCANTICMGNPAKALSKHCSWYYASKIPMQTCSYTQLLSGSSDYYVTALQLLNLNEPPNLDAQPTTQSQRNEMSHNYHGENRLSDEVVGDFSNNEDEIMTINDDNNINENDDNDIQFLFQPMTTENVYRPYPNCIDVGDNQVKQSRVGYSCSGFHAVMELTSFAALLLLSSCHYGSYFLLHLHVFLHKIEVPE
ncbi:hypothetical protein JHK84_050218 [Glycine max]|nr:hypothetical protein JHK84_050218 [Glycine max]